MIPYDYQNTDVRDEHERWVSIIGQADPYAGKKTIGIHEVLHAHFLLIDFFFQMGQGIGGVGPKNIDLLHSALGRQFASFGGKEKWDTDIDICATLMYGLIKNHPFHDANKRTSFLISILHLQKIGRTPTSESEIYEDLTVDIAQGNLTSYQGYNSGLSSPDREISTISAFFRRNTRKIDLGSKTITYRELDTLLRKRGMELRNPKHNKINIVLFKNPNDNSYLDNPKKLVRIGFPGWSKQVGKNEIALARKALKLDSRHGHDSQSFFNGFEDALSLIQKYKEPLERLAFR